MSIPMNLSDVEAWAPGNILPPGSHVCTIDSAEEGRSSGDHPQVEVTLRAVEGEYAGGTIKDWIVVTPQSLGRVRQVLEAAGIGIPEGEFDFEASALVGCGVRVTVREEPSNDGKMRSRVKAYEATDGAPPQSNGQASRDDDIPF